MVYDVVTYNGEEELFDIRYNTLYYLVDEFIVVEAPTTFSGKPKPLYFEQIRHRYPDVKYFVINEDYTEEEIRQARESPNTVGAEHWKHEFLQKESIKKALTHLDDNDIVYIGDCDEIWSVALDPGEKVFKLGLEVYTYFLNNRSSEEFWGTLLARYKNIKNECLNHLRQSAKKTNFILGWHFTSMARDLHRKLLDSYTEETYANKDVMDNLLVNIVNNQDFLGRDFEFWLDESNWPDYLTKNRDKFLHLIRKGV
jgi:beta-1,4-mannosyl-glycoprotein beta-1,4-N-acetylglucosaminyltransferase